MNVAELIEKLSAMPDKHHLPVMIRDGRGQWRDAESLAYNKDLFYIEEEVVFPEEPAE